MMRKAERVSMPIGFIFLILAMIMLLSSKISEILLVIINNMHNSSVII